MVAPVPAQLPNLPPRLHRPPHIHSLLLTTHQSLPTSPRTLTLFLLITYIQTPYFHALAHSFAQRRAAIPCPSKSLRTLSIATGVYLQTVSHDRFLRVQTPQLFFLHRLAASFLSLFTVFCSRFLCFQSFAASFPETPGVGVSVKSPGSSAATWTRRAHPTIIAVSSRVQVHG
jgi:hypothetical protein